MRIAFLLRKSAPDAPALSSVTWKVVAALRARGAEVDLITPEEQAFDLAAVRPEHDLYVLKSKSSLALSWAEALAEAGAPTVNTVSSSVLARDKIATTALLCSAGLPLPSSWATCDPIRLAPLLNEGPLWLKPPRGSRGRGVRRITGHGDLPKPADCTDAFGLPTPILAQAEVRSSGQDLKVYVVGDAVSGVSRNFPAHTLAEKVGVPAAVSPGMRDAALACGRILGLELYGVDILNAGERFVIADVNPFPGYKGALDASRLIADYLFNRAQQPDAHAVTAPGR
jgi:ribosomal protein S6--L-glutamate ligase